MVDIHDDLIETGVCTPEQVRETLDRYGAAQSTAFDPPFPDAEPAKGEPDDEATYASYSDAVPASLDEDGELPSYSIYARYWPTPVEKKDRKPLKYVPLVCGHKLKGDGFEPNHRNCERCWFNFFQTHGPLTQAVEEGFQQGGKELIVRLKGKTFFDNWLKFMSTVAFVKSQQEAAKAKENDATSVGSPQAE